MWSDRRGRLTVPDVMFGLMAFAFTAALYPVFAEGMQDNADTVPTEAGWLLHLLLPLTLLVLFSVIYLKAAT